MKHVYPTTASIFALLAAAGIIHTPAVWAAEPASLGLEEILVTAQKREESMQQIPLAVTAFGGAELEELDVASLQEIGARTPGLVFAAFSVGQPEIAIRGVGTKEDGASASDS